MSPELKKFLPWIIGGIVGLYLLNKFLGSRGQTQSAIVPQSQFVQTPQTDPLATLRGQAFEQLTQFGLGTIQAETQAAVAQSQAQLQGVQQQMQFDLANKNLDTQLAQTQITSNAASNAALLNLEQRQNDIAAQQAAVNRYYSTVNTGNILGSVNQALSTLFGVGSGGTIFGGSGNPGGVFGTPPIFGFSF